MILSFLMNKDSYTGIDLTNWVQKNRQGLKYYHKIEKIFKRRSQGSNKPLKRFLIKIHLWQKEFAPYFVNYFLNTDCPFDDYFNNCTCYYRCLWGRRRGGGLPSKDERVLNKWLNRLADALKRLAIKAVEAFPAIVGSVVGAILSFLSKAVGFAAEHTWL